MTRHRYVLIALLSVACQTTLGPTLPPRLASLATPDGVVGVYRDATGTHLALGDQDGGGQRDSGALPTIHLFSLGGETGRAYNSFVYGLAPAGATNVQLTGLETNGSSVSNGAFVIALQAKDVLPTQLVWTFTDATGAVLAQGVNITP